MAVTGLYFITQTQPTSSPYPSVLDHISRHASTVNATTLPPWQLIHHLCVETSSLLPNNPSNSAPTHGRRYLQFLALPHHRQGSMYMGASPGEQLKDSKGMIIVSTPTTHVEDFFQTIQKKMEPLWSYRMAVRVDNGIGYQFGDFSIRIGEIRQMSAGQLRPRGVVIEASLPSGAVNAEDMESDDVERISAQAKDFIIQGIWEQMGLQGGRSFVNVPGMDQGPADLDVVRQYMELLKFARADGPVKDR